MTQKIAHELIFTLRGADEQGTYCQTSCVCGWTGQRYHFNDGRNLAAGISARTDGHNHMMTAWEIAR